MDFNDSPEEAVYRTAARAWLSEHAPPGLRERRVREIETREGLGAARRWQTQKAEAGYACITWPAEWGGPAGSPIESVIFAEEEAKVAPPDNPFRIGLTMSVPTVLHFGRAPAIERFAARAMRGDDVWCQLFSEPAGGSDLAAARTTAEPAPDESGDWIVNGQKVWTTGAHLADFGLLLCRTDRAALKHQGLTMFWIDLKAPGVTIRPIHEMDGSAGFNEVFLDEVRLSDAQRLGPVGAGWKAAIHALMNERLAADQSGMGWRDFLELAQRVETSPGQAAITDRAVREQLADYFVALEGLRHTRNRSLTALSRGQTPGPENSIIKLVRARQMLEMANAAVDMLGPYGVIDDEQFSGETQIIHGSLFWAPGLRIAGGTDEVLRNIIAERVLGLPGDVRVDKDVPFREIPSGR